MKTAVKMEKNLTEGSILKTMLIFAVPMILGNLLQQVYNIADTMVVGRFLGAEALAAVGSAYTLMTFLTSVTIGLCMGSGAVFSIAYGAGNEQELKKSMWVSFLFVGAVTVLMNVAVFIWTEPVLHLLRIPKEVYPLMYTYIRIIFAGIMFTFLYNYFSCLLRAIGNSVVPLWFLAVSSVLNIILDIWFVAGMNGYCSGSIRNRDSWLCNLESSFSEAEKRAYAHGTGNTEQSSSVFYADLCPAVCDEFRDTYGSGTCEQFRNIGYGGVRCRGKD